MPDIDAALARIERAAMKSPADITIKYGTARDLVSEFKRLRAIEDAVRKVGTFEEHYSDNNRALLKALDATPRAEPGEQPQGD